MLEEQPKLPQGIDLEAWPEYQALLRKLMLTQPALVRSMTVYIHGVVKVSQEFGAYTEPPESQEDISKSLYKKFE